MTRKLYRQGPCHIAILKNSLQIPNKLRTSKWKLLYVETLLGADTFPILGANRNINTYSKYIEYEGDFSVM